MPKLSRYIIGSATGVLALVGSCLYERNLPEIHYDSTKIESVDRKVRSSLNMGTREWTELIVTADTRRIVYSGDVSQFKRGDLIDVTVRPRLFDSRLTGVRIAVAEQKE